MPPEPIQHKGPLAWKVIVSALIAAPLTVVTCGSSYLAVRLGLAVLMGDGIQPKGALLLGLAGLAGWYLYSMIVSLWLGRRGAPIILGLIVGLIFLSIGGCSIVAHRVGFPGRTWVLRDYWEAYFVSASWVLTLFLICRAAFSKAPTPSARRRERVLPRRWE